jgi:hypothetical protein
LHAASRRARGCRGRLGSIGREPRRHRLFGAEADIAVEPAARKTAGAFFPDVCMPATLPSLDPQVAVLILVTFIPGNSMWLPIPVFR